MLNFPPTARLLRLALFSSVLLAACSAPAPAPASPTPPARPALEATRAAATTAPDAAPTSAPPAPTSATGQESKPTASPAREQIIRVPLTEPPTLDPGLAEDNVSIDVISQVFEGLVAFDDKGTVSGLGAEKWDVSADGLTYTFTLRQGPRWSDGKPVTAQDYAWAWKRNVDPKTASPYATTLFPVKNARAIYEGRLDRERLGVVARDDRLLVVTLEQPAAYFLRLASTWTLMPLRQDAIERHGDRWTEQANIVTNGTFRLKEWQHDTQIVLERNEGYWGLKPTLQRAVYRLFPEGGSDQVLAAYEAGELDTTGAGASFELPSNQVDRILADPKLKAESIVFDQSATMFVTVNTRRPHLRDPRVRMALGMALDRVRMLKEVLKRPGEPAYSLQPKGIVGRKPELWPKEDVAAAKKLMADAGYPDGRGFPEITFTYNASAQWKVLAEYLQQRWKDTLNINVKLESMEWAVFLKFRRGDDWTQKGDLYRGGWFGDYEDPNNWYNLLWDSQSDPLAFNSDWRSDQFNALARQAAGELDPRKRQTLYEQAEEVLAGGYPSVPIFHYGVLSLVKPYVQGFAPQRVLGITPLRKIVIGDRR